MKKMCVLRCSKAVGGKGKGMGVLFCSAGKGEEGEVE